MLGHFFNTLTADEKYSFLYRHNLWQHLRMQLSQKKSDFRFFFFVQLGNLDSILKKLKKKMTLTADLFLNLRTPKTVVR